MALLQDEKLVVEKEESIFRAVVRWHEAAKPGEEEALALLQHVRFGLMPADFLKTTVSAWPLMASSLAANKILSEALMACMAGGTPPTARKPPRALIEWQVFDPNMVMSTGPDGETIFSRTRLSGYDIALGTALTAGRHEWMVKIPQDHTAMGEFFGVATSDCDRKDAPSRPSAWTRILGGSKTRVRVLLDMEARTLSFACDDNDMRVAFKGLPASVHPYLCSGSQGEVFKVLDSKWVVSTR